MNKLVVCVSGLGLALGLSACSIKAAGGGGDAPAIPQEKVVKGPDLTGSWSSGCQQTEFGEYKTFDIVFTANVVSRKSATYSEAQCTSVQDTKTDNGTYKYLAANKDGSYNVQYRIPLGNGVSALPEEKILLDNGVLYVSDFALGDAVTKQKMVALHKVASVAGR
jgi:hypothetical protein